MPRSITVNSFAEEGGATAASTGSIVFFEPLYCSVVGDGSQTLSILLCLQYILGHRVRNSKVQNLEYSCRANVQLPSKLVGVVHRVGTQRDTQKSRSLIAW